MLQVRRSERKPAGSGVVMLNQIVPAGNSCLAVGVFGYAAGNYIGFLMARLLEIL